MKIGGETSPDEIVYESYSFSWNQIAFPGIDSVSWIDMVFLRNQTVFHRMKQCFREKCDLREIKQCFHRVNKAATENAEVAPTSRRIRFAEPCWRGICLHKETFMENIDMALFYTEKLIKK